MQFEVGRLVRSKHEMNRRECPVADLPYRSTSQFVDDCSRKDRERMSDTGVSRLDEIRETQTLRAGCSKAEPKFFAPPQTPFPGALDGQNLISWRRSLPLPINPVWWRSMHAISSYRGNRPTHKQTHRQDRLQYTAPLSLERSVIIDSLERDRPTLRISTHSFYWILEYFSLPLFHLSKTTTP